MITIDEFKNIELKVAKIIDAKEHPNAEKLYILTIDLGGEKRQIIAGIRKYYTPEKLVNKNIIVVTNLAPANIRGIESNGMLLAAKSNEQLVLLTVDQPILSGAVIG